MKPRNENLVPMARLELARVSPPPPQDGVSTNFTTSATRCSASAPTRFGLEWSLYFGISLFLESAGAGVVSTGLAGWVGTGAAGCSVL
jgi:hypothetical protein